jgi:putative DNA primase/helicase
MTGFADRPAEDGATLEASIDADFLAIVEQAEGLQFEASQYRGQVRMAHEFAADNLMKRMHVTGVGWFSWAGSHWKLDQGDKQAQNAVMATIRRLAGDALGDKELLEDLLRCQTANGVRGVLQLASSLPGIAVHADDLDADPYLLNCANGTLELQGCRLRRHNPADRITKVCRASYNPSASSSVWTTFLEKSLPEKSVREFFQCYGGLSLIGKVVEHILTIATGEGRNGKGVAYQAIANTLGDYSLIADPSLFEQVKSNPNAASPAFLALRGARFAVLSETAKTARIDAALMKRLTGGDLITARSLYEKTAVTFAPSHSLLLVTNFLPALPSDDPAVWDRMRVIPFNVVIPPDERDPLLVEKLEQETDAILMWMLQGLSSYQSKGLGEPEGVLQATSQYKKLQDKVSLFIEEICTDAPVNGGDTTTVLHAAYIDWANAEGIAKPHQLGSSDFGRALDKLGFEKKRTNRGAVRTGLGVDHGGRIVQVVPPQHPAAEPNDPDLSVRNQAGQGIPYSE